MVAVPTAQAEGFLEDSSLSGALYLMDRNRDRKDGPGSDAQYQTNLSHTTVNANFDFVSGYANDIIGLDEFYFMNYHSWFIIFFFLNCC